MKNKIITEPELKKLTGDFKKQNKKIVVFSGSFDLLHIGHIRDIEEARQQGDILIILLNSDISVKKYKGPKRPIFNENDRAMMLASLENVDYVCLFDDINPKRILGEIDLDIYSNGPDWGKDCIERELIEKKGAQIHILQWHQGYSTTHLIKKILEVETSPTPKAVFIDRDGTLNHNKSGYIFKKEDFEYTERAIEALQKLSQTDYKIIIVTNQSGIAKGYYTEKDFHKLTESMVQDLQMKGVRIDKVYFCPHNPEDTCDCRKPKPGMLLEAVKDFEISLNKSWFIGDDERDVLAGRESNTKTIKIGGKMSPDLRLEPNFYAKNLAEAIDSIVNPDGKK